MSTINLSLFLIQSKIIPKVSTLSRFKNPISLDSMLKSTEINNKNKQFENSFKRNHKEQEILKIDK